MPRRRQSVRLAGVFTDYSRGSAIKMILRNKQVYGFLETNCDLWKKKKNTLKLFISLLATKMCSSHQNRKRKETICIYIYDFFFSVYKWLTSYKSSRRNWQISASLQCATNPIRLCLNFTERRVADCLDYVLLFRAKPHQTRVLSSIRQRIYIVILRDVSATISD